MARYEFRFTLSDVELSDEHQERVGRAIAEAGVLAVADLTPPEAITARYARNRYWCGIPPIDIIQAIHNKVGDGEL